MTDEHNEPRPAESEGTATPAPGASSNDPAIESPGARDPELPDDSGLPQPDALEGSAASVEGTAAPGDISEQDAEAAMLAMLDDLPPDEGKASLDEINFDGPSAANAEFQQLQQPTAEGEARNIEMLMDVDLPISIELGRTKMAIADILALGPGSVVELNKLAGEPVDLLVNHRVVARGEVVVVDENFGLRITQLMTPEERLKALAEE